MNFLFVHNNFPAQFRNLVEALVADAGHRVAAIGSETAQSVSGVELRRYKMPSFDVSNTHPFARRFDIECRRAEQVLFVASALSAGGFAPDIVFAHCGWGENIPLRVAFPEARLIIYSEFFYRSEGQDVHFDRESGQMGIDGLAGVHCNNAATLIALADADLGLSPTEWQRSTYPKEFQSKIRVAHEGVDLERVRPDPLARFRLPGGRMLTRENEVVTFVSRSLEPMRGFPVFLRAVPQILRARPNAEIVIVGGEAASYGPGAPDGSSWKSYCLNPMLPDLDLSRVHFLDRAPYDDYLSLLQISSAHVYLTYPFVLSWSLIEAMAVGCTIIGSDTPPVQEAIESGRNGLLTPFHDPDALAQKVSQVLADTARYASLGRAARETVASRYEKKDCVARAMQLLGVTPAAGVGASERPGLALEPNSI